MKNKILFSILLLLFSSYSVFPNVISIKGKVVDANSNDPLPGATVSVPDLRTSAITNSNGEFLLTNIPAKGTYLVEIKYIGYKVFTQVVDLANVSELQFKLQPTSIETKEVVVTGTAVSGSNKRTSTSATVLNRAELLQPSTNLVDALAKQVPGVSQISTGLAISKPVIRGLGYNRIVTLDNGVKQQGQQWGDEHGIEIDQFKAERVEVLRGAASLQYGSDALGGVINLLEPLPAPEGQVKGEVITNYSGNNGLSANSVMLEGNQNGFVWQGRGSYKNAYSFKTPTGYFPNSGYNETDVNGMVGLNKSWGYSHLNVSSFRNNIGFYDPVVNADGSFVNEDGEVYTNTQFKDRSLDFPRQDIRHFKISLNNNFALGSSGNLKADFGYQDNQRRELEDGPTPSLFFDLKTYSADLKYYLHETSGWQPVFGLSGDAGHSENKGVELLIPAYDTYGFGAFAYAKKSWEKSTLSLGARYDFRKNDGKQAFDDDGNSKFPLFSNQFSNVSGALGFTHQFTDALNFKANAGTAFRSPNPAELGSNGVHEGTFRYEVGNPNLTPERSYQADLNLEYDGKFVTANIGVYENYVHNYIYASNMAGDNIDVTDEDGNVSNYPVYRYGQVNANLYGAEASLTIHPVAFIHFENTLGYTHAQNLTMDKPLPFIPAANIKNELRFEPKIKDTRDSYFSVGVNSAFQQNRVDSEFETRTSGYTLLNAGIGTTLLFGKQPLKLSVSANNLLDQKYYDALSRLKPGRLDQNDPTFGIYNPGRNVTFGLYLPFVLKK
ncbi:TonB-dependent receptor [Pedobacter sp. HMF7647]|uniref:TonB-dependent receptor n=1 Tax=Hufsiella arboris TaxID=2695275 RepID=A0A7K1Y6R1_9SPHI|nr:TonB-dependent receptor [Hufsiella arboris]MXV49728.1 TonB-dependent receptor [Hufsiella arboris]